MGTKSNNTSRLLAGFLEAGPRRSSNTWFELILTGDEQARQQLEAEALARKMHSKMTEQLHPRGGLTALKMD